MATARSVDSAIAWMRRQNETGATGWAGFCLRASRMSYGLPGGWPDANAWWAAVPTGHRYPWTNRPPRGAAVYWRTSSPHGHVAISDGAGGVWGTDLPRADRIGLVPINDVRRRWGAVEVGWSDWLNGAFLPLSSTTPPTDPGGPPMSTPDDIARAVWEHQLPNAAGTASFRARTYLARSEAVAVWDHAIPETYGTGQPSQTARRTLRDIARNVAGPAGASAMLLDDGTERMLTDADCEAVALRLAAFMRPGDLPEVAE